MRILVCGGRDLDPALVWNWLKANAAEECADALDRAQHVLISDVIQGGATGADSGAADWARTSEIPSSLTTCSRRSPSARSHGPTSTASG